jgi:glycosyltransferase involved in cell wall biosynthesis
MHAGRQVALVIPALDEEASLAEVVRAFRARPELDLVVVVDNGSRDRTAEIAREAGALVVSEGRRGYGAALGTGIEHALGLGAAVVVLAEADGTFAPADLEPLLAGLAGADLVLGSRTAEMHGALRLGNRLVARFLSALWPGRAVALTDVGCTLRAFTAEAWSAMSAGSRADGPEFSPCMIGAAFRARLRVREIPVQYGNRRGGSSKHTGSPLAVARTAARMLRAILAQRFAS